VDTVLWQHAHADKHTHNALHFAEAVHTPSLQLRDDCSAHTRRHILNRSCAQVQFDARFPNCNQTRHCWQSYVDFHRCIKLKVRRPPPPHTHTHIEACSLSALLNPIWHSCVRWLLMYPHARYCLTGRRLRAVQAVHEGVPIAVPGGMGE
jgi:hypothetical protein